MHLASEYPATDEAAATSECRCDGALATRRLRSVRRTCAQPCTKSARTYNASPITVPASTTPIAPRIPPRPWKSSTEQSRARTMSATESPPPTDQVASSAARRKSGRVSKRPARFAPGTSPTGSTKRKRGDGNDSGVDATEAPSEEDSEESSEGEPDEEELRERRRKKKAKAPARKPAPKKAKINGESVSLAIRPASNATKKASKRPRKAPIRKSALPDETEGLYGTCAGTPGTCPN
jgi:hypothetical protein